MILPQIFFSTKWKLNAHEKCKKRRSHHFYQWKKHGAPKICRTFWALTSPSATAVRMISALRRASTFCRKNGWKKDGSSKKCFFGKMTLINGSSCMSCMSLKSFPTTYCNLIKCVDQACTCSVMFGLKTPSRGLSMGLETNQNSVCGYVLGVGQNNPALPKKLKQRSLKTFRIIQCSTMHEEMTSKHG